MLASGAAVQWLRDGLGLIADAAETEALARSVDSSDGVVFVPALAGLGSPHWAPGRARADRRPDAGDDARAPGAGDARGDRVPGRRRARSACRRRVEVLRADGGATANGFLMQFQADLLGCPVEVAAEPETTALGAAALAGLAVGAWSGLDELRRLARPGVRYEPALDRDEAERLREDWRLARPARAAPI